MTLLVFIGLQKGIRSNYSNRDSSTMKGVVCGWSLKTRIPLTAIILLLIIARAITLMDCIIKVCVLLIFGLQNLRLIII